MLDKQILLVNGQQMTKFVLVNKLEVILVRITQIVQQYFTVKGFVST